MKYIDAYKLKEDIQANLAAISFNDDYQKGYEACGMSVLKSIESLQKEQQEVDFEKELKNERAKLLDAFGPMNGEQSLAIKNFARHFYELGKNARNV